MIKYYLGEMCVELNDSQLQITLPDFAAFYWIINCDLLEQISSPDISLCDGLSEVETVAVQSSAEPMLIGYVVDDELHLGKLGEAVSDLDPVGLLE